MMTSVGEMLIVERRARSVSSGVVVQAFTDITSRGTPSEHTLSETRVHELQAPNFMCRVGEKGATSPEDDCVAVTTKKAPSKGKDRNRAVRESLRKRKEAKKMGTPSGVAPEKSRHGSSVSVTSADDDGLSEVMGSSADQLLDDYAMGVGGSTASSEPPTTVQQEASRDRTAVQGEQSKIEYDLFRLYIIIPCHWFCFVIM